jgi:hypothetical protein
MLGLLIPYIGLPAGLLIMMIYDDHRYEVGRICVIWSCIGLLAHLLIMALVGIGLREVLFAMLQGVRGAAGRSGGLGGYGGPGM